jgi:hypothetical protein
MHSDVDCLSTQSNPFSCEPLESVRRHRKGMEGKGSPFDRSGALGVERWNE